MFNIRKNAFNAKICTGVTVVYVFITMINFNKFTLNTASKRSNDVQHKDTSDYNGTDAEFVRMYHSKHQLYKKNLIPNHITQQRLLINEITNDGDVVLASFFVSQKDPQRNVFILPNFNYIKNFYTTVFYHKLKTVIMHDALPESFIRQYETPLIKFMKTDVPVDFTVNDFRFIHYRKFLQSKRYKYVFLADISDVYFWRNPFEYMRNNSKSSKLFLSKDEGTFGSNGWMVNKMMQCYKEDVSQQNTLLRNDGAWGGETKAIICLLGCISRQLNTTLKQKGNCNMAAFNWCVNRGSCLINNPIYTGDTLFNPFRHNCDSAKYAIIHDKCKNSHKKCMVIEHDKLFRRSCNR